VTKHHPGTGSGGIVPPPPGFLISPKAGLLGLLIAFGVAGVAFVALAVYVNDETTASSSPEVPIHGEQPTIEYVDDGQLAAIIPEEISRELQAELITWFQGMDRKPISDREQIDEPEWAAHLLTSDVRKRMDRLPQRVFGHLDNVPGVIDEPGPYRGTLVNVWGRVEQVDQATLRMRDGDREVSRIRLSGAAGLPWVATVAASVPDELASGDWVKIVGAFTKLWPDGDRPALHVFSTRPPIASFAPVSLREPRAEWLAQVHDATPEGSTALEDVPFYGMLNYLRTLGIDGYRELRDSGDLPVKDLTGTQGSQPLLEAPQTWRFAAVRLRVAPLHKEFVVDRSIGENSGNIEFIYRGYLVDDQTHPLLFMSPFAREDFDFAGARIVEVEGFFFKRRMVQGTNNKRYYLPILIGADIQPVDIGPVGPSAKPITVLAIVVLGSVLLFCAFVFLSRRSKRTDEEVRMRTVRRHQMRRAGATQED